jgi:hypothetical protein
MVKKVSCRFNFAYNEDHVDVVGHELFWGAGPTPTADDLTLLFGNHVRAPLLVGKHQFVYVFSTFVSVPYVAAKLPICA